MKLLVTFLLMICSVSFLQAQDKKPTKEETIAFIQRTVVSTVGMKITGAHVVTEAGFRIDSYQYKENFTMDGRVLSKFEYEFSLLDWASLEKFNSEPRNCGEGICELWVYFTKKIKKKKNSWKYGDTSNEIKEDFIHYLPIYIPTEKFESIKKAFLRLAEIAKEENNDPFAN